MAAPVAAKAAINAVLKLVSGAASGRGRDGQGGGKSVLAALAGAAAVPLLICVVVVSAPLGAWALLFGDDPELARESYGIFDASNVSGEHVSWYMDEADRLNNYARGTWSSGTGSDIYSTPDWRYLCAYDMALSENDFSLIEGNAEYYRALHQNLLTATSVTHTSVRLAEEWECDLEYAWFDEGDQLYKVTETWNAWTVNTKSMESSFRKRVFAGDASEDFLYFIASESGDWGADGGWGDQGNAIGAMQFDRRYALDDFLAYAINRCPGRYDYLAPWAGVGTIALGDEGLLSAWQRAYRQDPDKWIELQVSFEYDSYYVPGEQVLAGMGFDCSGRPDAIKGLVASLCNLNGVGGATRFFRIANLSNQMSDESVARALCNAIIDNPPQPYPQSYANRYRSELETVLHLLKDGGKTSGEPAVYVGDNPGAEGGTLSLDLKGILAANYRRSLYAVDLTWNGYGNISASFNEERFASEIEKGGDIRGLDSATTEEGKRIVEACKTVACPGENLCATWISQVYNAAGCGYPTGNANDMWAKYCGSTDRAELSPGMIVAVQHSSATGPGWTYGHVGIYIGEVDGVPTVMDSIGYIRTISLDAWIAQTDYSGTAAWGWAM